MVIFYAAIFLFVLYSVLIVYYWLSWTSIPEFFSETKDFETPVSIIIPARNEEKNIGKLLESLQVKTYPRSLSEIIVVNDHSTDGTAKIVKESPDAVLIELIDDSLNSYKKKAIETGIAAATGKLIITTDADCTLLPKWLETMVSFHKRMDSSFIAAPVVLQNNSSVVQIFQTLDFMVLQGITAASVYKKIHSMCNGANLAYEKKAFDEVNGFEGIDKIASGDDMLLMYKIWEKFPGRVHYLKSKDAVVTSQPAETWKEFFNQRIRWASKARFYKDWRVFAVLVFVYLFNLSLLALLIAGFWFPTLWLCFLTLLLAKTIVEFPLVYSVAKFFNKQSLLKYFVFFQPLHIGYTILAGLMGQFGKYEWKGRMVR